MNTSATVLSPAVSDPVLLSIQEQTSSDRISGRSWSHQNQIKPNQIY